MTLPGSGKEQRGKSRAEARPWRAALAANAPISLIDDHAFRPRALRVAKFGPGFIAVPRVPGSLPGESRPFAQKKNQINSMVPVPPFGQIAEERMQYAVTKFKKWATVLAVVGMAGTAIVSAGQADEADAKRLLKAMSDYLGAQKAISFDYDVNLELVSTQKQKIALASSGTLTLNRPDKLHLTRTGGFANVEMVFDGKTLTLLGKNTNLYTQLEAPGTIDQLVDVLREKYHRPVPGADLGSL